MKQKSRQRKCIFTS